MSTVSEGNAAPPRPYRGPWQITTIVYGAYFGFFVLFIWVSVAYQACK